MTLDHAVLSAAETAVYKEFDIPDEARRQLAAEMWDIAKDRAINNRDRMRAAAVLAGLAKINQTDRLVGRNPSAIVNIGSGYEVKPLHEEIQQMLACMPLLPQESKVQNTTGSSAPKDAQEESCQTDSLPLAHSLPGEGGTGA